MNSLASLPEALVRADKLQLSEESERPGTSSHWRGTMNWELPEVSVGSCCLSASAAKSGSEHGGDRWPLGCAVMQMSWIQDGRGQEALTPLDTSVFAVSASNHLFQRVIVLLHFRFLNIFLILPLTNFNPEPCKEEDSGNEFSNLIKLSTEQSSTVYHLSICTQLF